MYARVRSNSKVLFGFRIRGFERDLAHQTSYRINHRRYIAVVPKSPINNKFVSNVTITSFTYSFQTFIIARANKRLGKFMDKKAL
jgi:hypothetical protein